MIPSSFLFDQSSMMALLDYDPLVQDYRSFFSLLDWSLVEQWETRHSKRGRPVSHPEAAYLKSFLLRLREGLIYATQLRAFLLKHPLLIIEFGFCLELDPTALYGFHAEHTLPSRFWFGQKLRSLDQDLLQQMLHSTVTALQTEIPGLGETVAFDVKHIYAWVKHNNPRVYIDGPYDKQIIPKGDPDCRLGVKRGKNQEQADGTTDTKKEFLWGYGSGVAAATTPDYGDVVLAEYTQPFDAADVTHFRPLYKRTVLSLNTFPANITADAAFDAWYVYDCAARHGGIGAIPLNQHGHTPYERDKDGTPLCPMHLPMHPTIQFKHTNGYRAQRFQCPLLFPKKTGETCHHEQFIKGKGCVKDVNWEHGGLMRMTIDRESPLYHAMYVQRTSCERINSQAKELGIERPKVRNIQSVRNLNTLTYVIINVRALNRVQSINKGLLYK